MIREAVQNYLLSKGIYASRTADDNFVRRVIGLVRPMQTDRNLFRVGGPGDGGYLIPDDLDGVIACFSPGVSNVSNFEAELINRGIECFLADYSVNGPPFISPRIHFEKKFLGATNDNVYIRLETWLNRKAPSNGDLLLQMDIEGSEYAVILDTPDEILKRFRIVVVEFHYLHSLFDRLGSILINRVFQKLLEHFEVVHIHPNNGWPARKRAAIEIPPVMELTFLRKDRVRSSKPATRFPHPLDWKNVAALPDVVLPPSWYAQAEAMNNSEERAA